MFCDCTIDNAGHEKYISLPVVSKFNLHKCVKEVSLEPRLSVPNFVSQIPIFFGKAAIRNLEKGTENLGTAWGEAV